MKKEGLFLFAQKITTDRLEWIQNLISLEDFACSFYLTGEAVFSLTHPNQIPVWKQILHLPDKNLILDEYEARLRGFNLTSTIPDIVENLSDINNENAKNPQSLFWSTIQIHLSQSTFQNVRGFLINDGPYGHRTALYALRFFQSIIKERCTPELYAYLDGIHIGHANQKPSEFENIGANLHNAYIEAEKNLDAPKILACSRCATARGYWDDSRKPESINTKEVFPSFKICNLNSIIDRFEQDFPILGINSGVIWANVMDRQDIPKNDEKKNKSIVFHPPIVIFMTHSPYNTENSFGGLSFAMACANHQILTHVIFLEDGIYNLMGNHQVDEKSNLFNIQEIILATTDMKKLAYSYYQPSLDKRGIAIHPKFQNLNSLQPKDLNTILSFPISSTSTNPSHIRLIFF